jgi:hypothetical protein
MRLAIKTHIKVLDRLGTLTARALQGLRASLKGAACLVAIVIGISLSIGASPLEDGVVDALHPKDYIRQLLPKDEALCLIKLYGKESAFNRLAIGNIYGSEQTYGIPQLKNPIIAHMSSIEQVNYGIKYINHRYTNSCDAYQHWLDKGWH